MVVMAGEGQRFVKEGYTVPKPLIEVNGKTILEWTMSSVESLINNNLSFAIRSEHDEKYNITEKLKKLYGENVRFKQFGRTTRGNLETAYITSKDLLLKKSEAVAFLDSDNKYDILNFGTVLSSIKEKDFVILSYFKQKDKSDFKWCFCAVDPQTQKVKELKEKSFLENGQPMIGFFYWSSVEFFENIAGQILKHEPPGKNGEYYMSQAVSYVLKNNFPVYAFMSEHMVALGTPEDVKEFEK